MALLSAFASGLLFALGLVLGGMTQPSKVVGFLDISGDWDPSLAFVMGGALVTYAVALRLITRRERPVLGERFQIPTRRDLTPRLLLGAGLFGVGWGLGGFCPGPAFTAVASGAREALIFVPSMLAGMMLFRLYERLSQRGTANDAPSGARPGEAAMVK